LRRRLERVEKQAKSGDVALRKEVEVLTALLAHLDAGQTLQDFEGELPGELEPLTTKPLISIVNGPGGIDLQLEAGTHAEAARRGTQRLEGKSYEVQDGDVLNIRFNV
jgi:ribosome-binding ATPase YchF (GTP1/OBG family)